MRFRTGQFKVPSLPQTQRLDWSRFWVLSSSLPKCLIWTHGLAITPMPMVSKSASLLLSFQNSGKRIVVPASMGSSMGLIGLLSYYSPCFSSTTICPPVQTKILELSPRFFSFIPLKLPQQGDLKKMGAEPVHGHHSRPGPSMSHCNKLLTHPVFPLPLNTIFHTASRVIFTIINQIMSLPYLKPSRGSHLAENKIPTSHPGLLSFI